ncbi:Gag-Pol polyprotein [Phytophthora ramorum]|uniref:Gag-Pol polyprotein n=1 Tax=Phytophthora ramorum TaxID=164328 RepID=UPI0030A47011|nr:Gag-Pol polyprotein [Phytophthora ramorum]
MSPLPDQEFIWPTVSEIVAIQKAAKSPEALQEAEALVGSDDGALRNSEGAMWIPKQADNLQMRLCIVSHFGAAGHRGLLTILTALKQRFVWSGIDEDVKYVVHKCLHCASTRGGLPVPRLLGEALRAEKPNELLHWDFLYMSLADTGELYVLVLKDDFSKLVWLFPSMEATSVVTYNALMDWFATFGICYNWVSDQGNHFKNEVIKSLQHGLGAHHGLITLGQRHGRSRHARCSALLQSATFGMAHAGHRVAAHCEGRPTCSEQFAVVCIGWASSCDRDGRLEALSPLDAIAVPGPVEFSSLEIIRGARQAHFDSLEKSLADMHKAVTDANTKTRSRSRKSKDARAGAQMTQFVVGYFVLYADVWSSTRTKLSVRWCGPARITSTISNWIFLVENLITGDTREVHATRLKFYADSSSEVTEGLLQHVAHNSEGHVVDTLRDARYDVKAKQFPFFVHWRGLSELEDSWESATTLLEDVTVLAKAYLRAHLKETIVKRLITALNNNLPKGEVLTVSLQTVRLLVIRGMPRMNSSKGSSSPMHIHSQPSTSMTSLRGRRGTR